MQRLVITLLRQRTGESVFIPIDAEDATHVLGPQERCGVEVLPSEPYNDALPVGRMQVRGPGSLAALVAQKCAIAAGDGWAGIATPRL